MDKTSPHGKQTKRFTRDDVARIVASTLDQVLVKLSVQQIVEGIAVFPAGKDVLVDVVVCDLSISDTWGVSITIPPAEEATHERDP